ncbi:MAG: hypothetical protein MI784_08930 [Cytophagales bacterium]|nr:hypothetical protein [Cytophagales bacterium]
MKFSRFVITACIFMLPVLKGFAQDEGLFPLLHDRFLNYGSEFPKDIRSSRSAVLVQVEDKRTEQRSDWKKTASELHPLLRELFIDPVAYFYADDFFAGVRPLFERAYMLRNRRISNLLFLKQTVGGGGEKRYQLIVSSFNGKRSLVSQGQGAYYFEASDLPALMEQVNLDLNKTNPSIGNHLILDRPEYFDPQVYAKAQIFQSYNQNLKSGQLGVPEFKAWELPDNIPANTVNSELKNQVERENQRRIQEQNQLDTLLAQEYPFAYAWVAYDQFRKTEEKIRKKGSSFVLLCLHDSEASIKSFLNWKEKGEAKPPVSTEKVYKFYVKHLKSGRLYTGKKWDGGRTKPEALRHFIRNLKAGF